jgi:S-adenosylhomocysteine hydrolase
MRQYTQCLKAQGRRSQAFTAVDGAVDWLKRNHNTMLVGSLVVIAGLGRPG